MAVYKGFLIIQEDNEFRSYRNPLYRSGGIVSYRGDDSDSVQDAIDSTLDMGEYQEEREVQELGARSTTRMVKLGALRAVSDLLAKQRIKLEPSEEITMYHFTREEYVDSILQSGLQPSISHGTGLGGVYADVLPAEGVYLSGSVDVAEGLLDDYNRREERVPGTFSLLSIRVGGSFPAYEDPEVFPDLGKVPAMIIPRHIEPNRVSLHTRNFFIVDAITGLYREFPGFLARMGHRVKINKGEHYGKEGVVSGVPDMVDRKAIWPVDLDTGEKVKAREDDIITLIR